MSSAMLPPAAMGQVRPVMSTVPTSRGRLIRESPHVEFAWLNNGTEFHVTDREYLAVVGTATLTVPDAFMPMGWPFTADKTKGGPIIATDEETPPASTRARTRHSGVHGQAGKGSL